MKSIHENDDLINLVCHLIEAESTSLERINQTIQYCANWLMNRGVMVEVFENQGLKSLVASTQGKGKTIILNGHVDVVAANPKQFFPRIEDGKLYGRGSYDMLGAVAVMMTLMVDFVHHPPSAKIILMLVPDEEQGGQLGTGYLVNEGFIGDFVICGEPTDLHIAIQAKGVLQLKVEQFGKAAHGSRPWLGINAITKAIDTFQSINRLGCVNMTNDFFPNASFAITKIEGGKELNQVPDFCSFSLDIRYLPEQNEEVIISKIRHVAPDANISILNRGKPVYIDPQNYYVLQLQEETARISENSVRLFGQDGSADTRYFAELNIPAVEFGPRGANHHGPEEYVEISSLYMYKNILKNFIEKVGENEGRVSIHETKK